MQTPAPLLSTRSIENDKVINPDGKDIGCIRELMIDMDTGKVEYAVLCFRGVPGIGDKYFALPWGAISVDQGNACLVVDIRKEQLANAPGFDRDVWPDPTVPQFRQNTNADYHAYY